ncbi:hypothetical protein [Gaetbulibacter aestuarii]|uniref:Uncharacterized protein n=1 Tax=Gaetbulibacter aestuarii TaxID=1502358 RepID=A0ABW7N180_9FLAO
MIDPHTGEEFEQKRSNQRFATPQNRKDFHNAQAKKLREEMKPIQQPLNTNYKILRDLMKGKIQLTESKEFMRGRGYDITVIYSLINVNGKTGYAINEFNLFYNDDYVTIIRSNRPK